MAIFKGFPEGKTRLTPIPEAFFREILLDIDHIGELKLTLYIFWQLEYMEGTFRYLGRDSFVQDKRFMQSLGDTTQQAEAALDECLERATRRGTLLRATLKAEHGGGVLYFLNSPKGRAALRAIQSGRWRPTSNEAAPVDLDQERPNLYQLYEENFGPITPLLAEALGEAEDTYPSDWIEDAIRIAVERNKRNWRYVSAILERWQREGRDARKEKLKDRRDSTDPRRFAEGEFSDLIEY